MKTLNEILKAPKANTDVFVNVYEKSNGKYALCGTYTVANVDGIYYLIKGTRFSMVCSAIRSGYEAIMNEVIKTSKNFNTIKKQLVKPN